MDYEKKYKDALEWMREMYPCLTDSLREDADYYFPELRESEDERIRKWLLECVENLSDGNFIEVSRQDVLFYLEKQKEQPTDAKSERVIKAARSVLNNWLDGTDCPDVSGDFAELEYAIREYDGEEKQKEQKPHWEPSEEQHEDPDKSLEEEVKRYYSDNFAYISSDQPTLSILTNIARHFAEWKAEQFEKNRLSACDALTKEEYDREVAFSTEIIEKEHRQPTFSDAINYGMQYAREQMLKDAVDVQVVGEQRDLRLINSTQRCLFDAKRGDWLEIIIVKED